MLSATNNLVTIPQAIEAHKHNNQNGILSKNIFIDGSWHMPVGSTPRNGREEFKRGPRIKDALYFDIDDIAPQPGSPSNVKKLPHMKPSTRLFAAAMDRIGVSPNDTLYVYANEGCGFYHRAYWTLRSSGHDPKKVKLVQGSLEEWKANGGELEYGEVEDGKDSRLFRMSELDWENATPEYKCWAGNTGSDDDDDRAVDMNTVLSIVNQYQKNKQCDAIIVDARSEGRFYGTAPEPRPGLRGGHMPGSINVPFTSLLDGDLTKFKSLDEVRDIFVKAGIPPLKDDEDDNGKRKVICSCGSGVTAAALAVGLEECGLRKREDIYIFDGSWIEWGGDDTVPVVTYD
jgi:thiosulfate/3-mercaptopyruvate sulfurtransferase